MTTRARERVIDFVDPPYGLTTKEVVRLAQVAEILDGRGQSTGISFRVMHPVHCLESRVYNTMGLPGYDDETHVKQLRAAVPIAREFLQDLLAAGGLRAVLRLNERIYRFALSDISGSSVDVRFGVDPFEAVLVAPRLPARFREIRYPQMKERLLAKRRRRRASPGG